MKKFTLLKTTAASSTIAALLAINDRLCYRTRLQRLWRPLRGHL